MAYDLIVATTKIVNGATLIETFMEKLGWSVNWALCSSFLFRVCLLIHFLYVFVYFSGSLWLQSEWYAYVYVYIKWLRYSVIIQIQ